MALSDAEHSDAAPSPRKQPDMVIPARSSMFGVELVETGDITAAQLQALLEQDAALRNQPDDSSLS